MLLVEDDPDDVILFEHLLNQGSEVPTEVVVRNSLEHLRADPPEDCELVITDLALPDADGVEAIHAVRSRLGDVPILVFTGSDTLAQAREAAAAGADDYLVKQSADAFALHQAIHYALQRRTVAEELDRAERRRMVGQLAGSVAHELNNLLTIIRISAEGLDAEDPRTGRIRTDIEGAVEQGADVTRRLLALGRTGDDPLAEALQRASDDRGGDVEAPEPGTPQQCHHASPSTVLVIEDDPAVRSAVARTLRRRHFEVRVAADEAEAVDGLGEPGSVDVILADLALRDGVTGFQVVRRLHRTEPDLPVVYMSGHPAAHPEHASELIDDQTFIQKPFQPDDLERILRQATWEQASGSMEDG